MPDRCDLRRERRVAVHEDVAERVVRGEVAQDAVQPAAGEVPDLVVVEAEVGDDLLEPATALERQLDLDRNTLGRVQDRVGQVSAKPPVGAQAPRDRPLAFPSSESQLPVEKEAHVGHGLEVVDEPVARLPGAQPVAGDRRAAAGQPDERRQVDGETSGARPAGVDPAVPESAGGPVAAPDQDRELVERECVLLGDVGQQLAISVGDLVAALVSACSPASLLFVSRERFFSQCRSLLPSISVSDPVCSRSRLSSFGVAAVVRDLSPSDGSFV